MEGDDNSKIHKNDIQNEGITKNSTIIQLPPPILLKPLKSICKIVTPKHFSSGFLIKFFKGDKDFFGLLTNEHIITKELIKQRKTITIYYDSDIAKEIDLNPNERFIKEFKTELNIDATFIEIIPKDKIEKNYFLLPLLEYMNKFNDLIDKEITIIHYPLGGKLSYSNGEIKEINTYQFTHLASTQLGSSGSPIFLKDTSQVIGIHKSGKQDNSENYGDFIGPIFNYFKYKFKHKITLINEEYYIGELINNLKNGKGIIYYKNGNIKYKGYFVCDKFEGNGKYIKENGQYYIGEWKINKLHGKGKEYKDGKLIFEGEYLNNKRNGKGKEYEYDFWTLLKIFEGDYLNGERNGKGKEYYKDGKLIFEGEYLNGKKFKGKCKEYYYNSKLLYDGEYLNLEGKIYMKKYDENGNLEFEGEYLNGKRNGKGKK